MPGAADRLLLLVLLVPAATDALLLLHARSAQARSAVHLLVHRAHAPQVAATSAAYPPAVRRAGFARMDLEGHDDLIPEFYGSSAALGREEPSVLRHDARTAAQMSAFPRCLIELNDPAAVSEAAQRKGGVRVFFFGARWCSTCRALQPCLRRFAATHPSVECYTLSHTPALADIFSQQGVTELPTLHVYDARGQLLDATSFSSPHEMRAFERRLDATLAEQGDTVWGP